MDPCKTENDGTPIHEDEISEGHTSTDAKGFLGNLLTTKKKKTSEPKLQLEQTDSVDRIPKYDTNYDVDNFRGQAVIINNENFHSSTGMNQRKGTRADEINLCKLFRKLAFDVKIFKDQTREGIKKVVHTAANTDHSKFDCFFMVFLSHGDDGVIYGTDGTLDIKPLTDQFAGKTCPSLIGKPKVFLFQACRGYNHEDPVEKITEAVKGVDVVDGIVDEVVVDAGVRPTLPNSSDFLFCYSVTEGFYSHRDTLYGSWYIQAFVEVFEEELINRGLKCATQHDILSLLTLVNHKVSGKSVERTRNPAALGKKQMPCFLSMLTKRFYLVTKQ